MKPRTKNRKDWEMRIASLPPGLTQWAAAKRLKRSPDTVRGWLLKLGYPYTDGRTCIWDEGRPNRKRKLPFKVVEWSLPNVVIARAHGVSRERVRQVRERLGKLDFCVKQS